MVKPEYFDMFIDARDYLYSTLGEKINAYLLGSWDPINKHNIIKGTIDIIKDELVRMFPDLPERYLPNCRFRIFEEEKEVEAGIQNFFNHEYNLTYLGTTEINQEYFDFYFRNSFDPRFDYMFIARYGHEPDDFIIGSKTAEAEYYLGQHTPLAHAYGIARDDGYIE